MNQIAHRAPPQRAGRTPLLVLGAIALAIGLALCALYKPWNFLRYGRQDPPLPTTGELQAPLSERILERVAAVRASPYDATAWGKLGETYDVHEMFPQAIECYERAQLLAPKESRWPYWLGIAQRIGNQAAALAQFERAVALEPTLAAAHFYAGHGYLSSERVEDAAAAFKRALEHEPTAPAAWIGLAKVAMSKDDPAGALECLENAERNHPTTREARWLMAGAWRARGDEKRASEFAGPSDPLPAQEPFPDKLRSKLLWDEGVTLYYARQRADSLLGRGETDAALAQLQSYLDRAPRSVDGLIALADLYARLNQHDEAISRYQAACTLDPTRGAALSQWGALLAKTGKAAEGTAKLRQALELEPSRVEFQSNLGSILCSSSSASDREEGLRLVSAALGTSPDDPRLRVNYAQALRVNGRAEESIPAFQSAIELAREDPRLQFEYGVVCASAGKLDLAAGAFARVLELDPTQFSARMNLVRVLTESGRHPEALVALRTARESAPNNLEVRGQLAWLLATSPDAGVRSGAEALALAKELTSEDPLATAEFMVIRAAAEAESGDLDAAKVTLEGALRSLQPKNSESISNPVVIAIIDRALACRKAFGAGQAYRNSPTR